MRIKSLHFTNFRGLKQIDIDELDKNANLFIGINGVGKSSILDAIACLLSRYTKRISNAHGLGGNDIALDDVALDSKEGATISLTTDNNVTWTLYRSRELAKDGKSDLSQLNTYLKELRTTLAENPKTNLPTITHYKVNRAVAEIPLKIKKYKVSALPVETYVNALDGNTLFRDFFSWFREQEDLENEKIRDDQEYRDKGLDTIRRAMHSIFPEYGEMRVKRHPQALVLSKNDTVLKLNQLSDGEKCYIALVCDLTRRLVLANPSLLDPLQGEGIVLIDEIDLHLHPQWQLSALSKLTQTFPNCQFIITTHSPIVASDTQGKVFGLANGELTPIRTFGRNADTILSEFFDVPHPRSPYFQSILDGAYKAIHKNDDKAYQHYISILLEKGIDPVDLMRLEIEKKKWDYFEGQ